MRTLWWCGLDAARSLRRTVNGTKRVNVHKVSVQLGEATNVKGSTEANFAFVSPWADLNGVT